MYRIDHQTIVVVEWDSYNGICSQSIVGIHHRILMTWLGQATYQYLMTPSDGIPKEYGAYSHYDLSGQFPWTLQQHRSITMDPAMKNLQDE